MDSRRRLSAVFYGVRDEILEQHDQIAAVSRYHGQVVIGDEGTCFINRRLQILRDGFQNRIQIDNVRRDVRARAHFAVGQQI